MILDSVGKDQTVLCYLLHLLSKSKFFPFTREKKEGFVGRFLLKSGQVSVFVQQILFAVQSVHPKSRFFQSPGKKKREIFARIFVHDN